MNGVRDEDSSMEVTTLLPGVRLAPTLTRRSSELGERSPSLSLGVMLEKTNTRLNL